MLRALTTNPVTGTWFRANYVLATLALLGGVTAIQPVSSADVVISGNYKLWQVAQPSVQQRSTYRRDLHEGRISDPAGFDHVVRWKLSELTREENLLELPKLRRQLRHDLAIAGRADRQTAHDRINSLAVAHLPPIVNDGAFHGGTRYNALLMLGDLNAVEERLASATAATPLTEVLPLLVDWLELPADDAATPDMVPLGAMLGILRHAQLGIADDALRHRALQAAARIAAQRQPPEGRTLQGHDWLRRRAIHLIGWLARPEATPADDEACSLVWRMIDDSSGSLKLQVEAALACSLLASRMPVDRLEAAEALDRIVQLAGRIIRSEMKEGRSSVPVFARPQSRRVLAARLGSLSHACQQLGVDAVALRRSPPPAEVASLADLYSGLKAWIAMATDPNLASSQAAGALCGILPMLERAPQRIAERD